MVSVWNNAYYTISVCTEQLTLEVGFENFFKYTQLGVQDRVWFQTKNERFVLQIWFRFLATCRYIFYCLHRDLQGHHEATYGKIDLKVMKSVYLTFIDMMQPKPIFMRNLVGEFQTNFQGRYIWLDRKLPKEKWDKSKHLTFCSQNLILLILRPNTKKGRLRKVSFFLV